MKLLSALLVTFFAVGAMADDYAVYRRVIVDSTQMRIDAAKRGDAKAVCNVLRSAHGTDTMVYYLAFETLERPNAISDRLLAELGHFAYRNYESIAKRRLAVKLHTACTDGAYGDKSRIGANKSAVIAAAMALEGEIILEGVQPR